jgi:hypothetical protein
MSPMSIKLNSLNESFAFPFCSKLHSNKKSIQYLFVGFQEDKASISKRDCISECNEVFVSSVKINWLNNLCMDEWWSNHKLRDRCSNIITVSDVMYDKLIIKTESRIFQLSACHASWCMAREMRTRTLIYVKYTRHDEDLPS